MKIDMPGIGGSLGECVICGKSFALEVMLGRNVETLKMEGFRVPLPVHSKCADEVIALSKQYRADPNGWKHLPDGPLRREFAEAVASTSVEEKQ